MDHFPRLRGETESAGPAAMGTWVQWTLASAVQLYTELRARAFSSLFHHDFLLPRFRRAFLLGLDKKCPYLKNNTIGESRTANLNLI